MKNKNSKPRSTPAERIRQLNQKDTWEAARLAERGKQFSEIESLVWWHFESLRQLDKKKIAAQQKLFESIGLNKERIAVIPAEIEKVVGKSLRLICTIFANALCAGDSSKIHEIAKAVDSVKNFKPTPEADKEREIILMDKLLLDEAGEKREIRHLAILCGVPETERVDGFARLRRRAKELHYPIKESRRGRHKGKLTSS